MRHLVLVLSDLRSTHNVGSLLRTAEGLGVSSVYFCGYTPYPRIDGDKRLIHVVNKLDQQIHKTALGAEQLVSIKVVSDTATAIASLKAEGYSVVALEQAKHSVALNDFRAKNKVALVLGNEVEGLAPDTINLCDQIVEIPMLGQKESFNVVQAAAMALYYLRFVS